MKRKIKNAVILSNRKLIFVYELTDSQLDLFLNDNLDRIIICECDEPQNIVKITSNKEGIIINNPVTAECYSYLTKYLNQL